MAENIMMKVHVKYRLYVLVYCMKLLSYISIPLALRLGDYIMQNLDIYMVVKGVKG